MPDVVIVGAGIVGAACADALSGAGLRVTIVEENGIGSGATNAGMGHLVTMDDSPPQFALTTYSLQLWRELANELPVECGYWQCGTLWIAAEKREIAIAKNKRGQFIAAQQLVEFEPNLRPGLAGGVLIPDDASVHPASAANFFAGRSGADLIPTRAVHISDGEVRLSDGSSITAAAIINATGTAAATLTPGLPIRARKGHIVVVDPGPDFARHQIAELGYVTSTNAEEGDSVAFNVRQNRNGELLVGSSRQYGVEDPQSEPAVVDRMLARAFEFMPALKEARQLRSWTGFRAGTSDGLPLIGKCPGYDRVYAATGHEGLGATTSLATARLLADQILGRASQIDPRPFDPARFHH